MTAMDTAPAFSHTQGVPLLNQVFRFCCFTVSEPFMAPPYSDAYLPRRRWRISSARVFITKVNSSSTMAARNSTR